MATKPARIEQAKSGIWYVHYAENGRSQRASLRTKVESVAQQRFGGWLEDRVTAEMMSDDPTVERILELWYTQWIDGRMLSQVRYPSVINNLTKYFGDYRISQLMRRHSKEYIALRSAGTIGTKPAANGTIRQELLKLRAAFNFMWEKVEPRELRIDRSLIPYVELPPESPPRDEIFTKQELSDIYHFCMNDGARAGSKYQGNDSWLTREARFIIFAMETAQRKTAILELTWEQIHMDRKWIRFNPTGRHQTSKRRAPVPISDKLMAMLEKIQSNPRPKTFYPVPVLESTTGITHGFKRIMDELGLVGSPHKFRHTWASHAAMDGVPMNQIAAMLGDTQKTVEKNYLHLSPDYLRSAVNRDSESYAVTPQIAQVAL